MTSASPYDEIPYTSFPFPQSHPTRLATIATLFGMQPADITGCRVLELGCASGGNLIPMAAELSGSQFVGVDLSGRQIAAAQETIERLRLKNIEVESQSILDIDSSWGTFDYIIAHGVWSWVPEDVRDKMLTICAEQLNPQGVAFISYNTYPGWHMRGTIREMMVYHCDQFATPKEQVAHARALLDFLVRSVPEDKNAYSILLKNEMELLRDKEDCYLAHEHLEKVNHPVYFHEFDRQASAKGLQFLGESDLGSMLTEGFGPDVEPILRHLAKDVVQREQYLDFLRNRTFRQTLLCRNDVALNRRPDYERIRKLWVAAALSPADAGGEVAGREPMKFTGPLGSIGTADPWMKAALSILGDSWPQAVAFDKLLGMVNARLNSDPVMDAARSRRDAEHLASSLLQCHVKRFVELMAAPPRCVSLAGARPVATPLARLQAESGNLVTNTTHHLRQLSDLGRHVLRLADGEHDRDAMLNCLLDLVESDKLVVNANGEPTRDRDVVAPLLSEALSKSLDQLARDALLLG